MHAERTGCPHTLPPGEIQRLVMIVILTEDHSPWSRSEIQCQIASARVNPGAVIDAIGDLRAAGLLHVSGELVTATRPARYMDELDLIAI
jgi:hypothetical protein